MKFLTRKGQPFYLSSDSLSSSRKNGNLKKLQNSVSISFLKNYKLLIQSFKRYKLPTLTLYLDVDCRSIKSLQKTFFCKLITPNELSSLYRASKYLLKIPPPQYLVFQVISTT